MNLEIDKIFAEVGRLHMQVMLLTEQIEELKRELTKSSSELQKEQQ
jgi:regulator of replication initiation timing